MSRDSIRGTVTGDDDTDAMIGKGIYRDTQNQSQSVHFPARDLPSILYSVEREVQVVHREIASVKTSVQGGFLILLLLLTIVLGTAIFLGDRQINRLHQQLIETRIQLEQEIHDLRLEINALQRRWQNDVYTPDHYIYPGDPP